MREIRLVLMVHASIMRDVSNVEVGHYLLTYLLTYSHYDLLLAAHFLLLSSQLLVLTSHLLLLTSRNCLLPRSATRPPAWAAWSATRYVQ